MNPSIDQSITPILLAPQTLLTNATKKVVVDATLGCAWFNRTPHRVSRTGFDGITPGKIHYYVSFGEAPYPVLIGIVATSSPCGLNAIQQVANKRKSASPVLVGNTQKLDAVVDGNFPDALDSASIFSKVIGQKLSNSYRSDLYSRCRINFAADPVQIQTPQFMDMWFSAINALYETIGPITPDTIIQIPMDGSHWRVVDHFLVKQQR